MRDTQRILAAEHVVRGRGQRADRDRVGADRLPRGGADGERGRCGVVGDAHQRRGRLRRADR